MFFTDSIASGRVLKIHCKGDLSSDGFERGYLILFGGSSIKMHKHLDSVERYKVIFGSISVNGVCMDENICLLNDSHCIDEVDSFTVVETYKISKDLIVPKVNIKCKVV